MITVAILTVSDSAAQGRKEDLSGPALRARCEQLNWPVLATRVVADEQSAIASALEEWADSAAAAVILTTGGTGVAARDVTPEATRGVLER
ncbi:MAG: molybdenum cofactor biosynthesis protein, partial [Acidobacteriaceae bacterium]|nr:molybdenum cofactor biosynthesis protein [Acidobacteriaceae bacterium]